MTCILHFTNSVQTTKDDSNSYSFVPNTDL